MPGKKNGSKKYIKTTNVLRNSHVVNQSGGRNAQQIQLLRGTVGENFNHKNVLTLLSKKIADNCVSRLHVKDSKSSTKTKFIFTQGKIELIKRAIEKEVENSNNLSAPIPSIIAEAEDKIRSEFVEEFTDKKLTEGPIAIGQSVTELTQGYATMQQELNEECKKIEKSPEADNSITTTNTRDYEQNVGTIEAAIKAKNTKFIAAINSIIEKNKANAAEAIVVPTVKDGKLECATGIFAPIHDVVIEETQVQQFDPASVLLPLLMQDVGTIINQHSVEQPLFTESSAEPKVVTASTSSEPPLPPSDPNSGNQDKLMVSKKTFEDFGTVVIEQLKALYAWISNLAREGLYNFKASLSIFINKIEALLKSSVSIFITVAALCIKHFWTSISLYAKNCGFAISKTAQTASKAYKANTQIVFATRPEGITIEEFNKICYTFDQGCGGTGLFFVERNDEGRDVIVWRFVLSSIEDKCAQFALKVQQLATYIHSTLTIGGTSFMNYLFNSMSISKEKCVKLKKFTDDDLSQAEIAALQKKCMAACQKGSNVHTARKALMKGIRAININYITPYAQFALGVAGDVKQHMQNGTDRALFSVILMAEDTGMYSLAEIMRKSFFRINLLTQTGYIRSLESKNESLKTMYANLKQENKRLIEELYKNPLMRSTLKYNEFLQKVYGNIDNNPNSSYLIREAKKEQLNFTTVIGSSSGQQTIDYMVALQFGTQQSTVKKDIESTFNNNGMTPYVDLCRLLGILWDLHVLEETIDVKKPNPLSALIKPVRQAFNMIRPQQTSIQVVNCDSIDKRGLLSRIISSISNSKVIKGLVASGVTIAQAYFIKNMVDERSPQSTVSPAVSFAPIAVYYGLTLLVNMINHHTEQSLPMCMVLSCQNGTMLKLPLYLISRVSTVFSDPQITVEKGKEDTFYLRPKTQWLNTFLGYLSGEEKVAIKDAIANLRSRILQEICSPEEYYSRRDKIFMDKVFGTDIKELSRIYSGEKEVKLSLIEILDTTSNLVVTPTSTETTFTIEYCYWMLLKAVEMKYGQGSSGRPQQIQTEDLKEGPARLYIARINEYYHDNINAKMELFMAQIAELKARQEVAMKKANDAIIRILRGYLTNIENLHSKLESVRLLKESIIEFIANIEKDGANSVDLSNLESINLQYAAHLRDNGISKGEIESKEEIDILEAKRNESDHANIELTEKLRAASEALYAERAEAEKNQREQKAALTAAAAELKKREEEEEDKRTRLLIQSILEDIKRDNLYFNSMVVDLENDVKKYILKYSNNPQTNVKNLIIYDQVLFQKLDKFMEVVSGTHRDFDVFQRLNVIQKAITGTGRIAGFLSEEMIDERVGHLINGKEVVYDLESIIKELQIPLAKCEAFFKVLSGVSSKIDSIESITANLKKYCKTDETAMAIGTSYIEKQTQTNKGKGGGRNRKNKNRTRKCKNSFTKKIRYVRKNRKNSKIKLYSRCRRK